MLKSVLLVASGGALGALARYVVTVFTTAQGVAPWGTFIVNILGCFLIGILIAQASGSEWYQAYGRSLIVVGFLGAFTTFSAFSLDTLELAEQGKTSMAIIYAAITVSSCLAATYTGLKLASN